MKNILLISLLLCSFTYLNAESEQNNYLRLSKKLVSAEKEMTREYRHTSKSLGVNAKRELRMDQHIWKLNRDKVCTKVSIQKKVQDRCKYKKIIQRTKYLKLYDPDLRFIGGMDSSESNVSILDSKLNKPRHVKKVGGLAS